MRVLPLAASAATGILVGSAMVATRFVVDQTGPASLALLRYAIGFCCLVPFVLVAAPDARPSASTARLTASNTGASSSTSA